MSRDLRDLLTGFAEQEGRAATATAPDPAFEARLLGRRVARRRAVRAGAVSVTSAAAVVGVAAGVNALVDREEPAPPAHTTSTPTVTPTPRPTPSATPTSTPTAEQEVTLPPVTEHPLLPDAEPLPPGTFERTGEGWVLAQRSLVGGTGEYGDGPIEHTYFYLVDPAGTRYEVPFDTERPVNLVDWLPGTTTAVVQLGGLGDWSGGLAVLDLGSGDLSPLPEGVHGAAVLLSDRTVVVAGATEEIARYDADGTRLGSASVGGRAYELDVDPTRTQVVVTVQDAGVRVYAADLEPVDAPGVAAHLDGRTCDQGRWLDAATLVLACQEEDPGVLAYWTVPLEGSAHRVAVGTTRGGSRATVLAADGRTYAVLPAVMDEDGVREVEPERLVEVLDGGDLRTVEPFLEHPAATGALLVGHVDGEGDQVGDLVALDPRTGATTVVMPAARYSADTDQVTYTPYVVAR